MMMADAYCMPYRSFLNLIFARARDCNWTHLPQPTQLYAVDVMAHVVNQYEEQRRERLITARHPVFDLDNYCGLKLQDAYRDWLIATLKEMGGMGSKLGIVLYERPQLPLDLARKHFSDEILEQARLASA